MAQITIWGDFKANQVDRLSISGELTYLLNTSDINVVNFEAPVKSNGKAIAKSGPNIKQHPDAPAWLERYGFNVISLANNHTMDYGIEGFKKTKSLFRKSKVIGCGTWDEAYHLEIVKTSNNMRVGFLACTHCEFGTLTDKEQKDAIGCSWLSHPDIFKIIKNGKEFVDCLIVIAHAGIEYLDVPLPEIRDMYKHFIEFGADAVIASHPHVPQGWEIYQGKPICYSLGNFCFSQLKKDNYPPHWYESLCCIMTIDKPHIVNLQIRPIIYQAEKNYISDNSSKTFKEHIEQLNSILLDEHAYMEEVNKNVKRILPHYMSQFTRGGLISNPFSKGFLKGLVEGFMGRGFFNRVHSLNNIQCESHRWAIVRAMRSFK